MQRKVTEEKVKQIQSMSNVLQMNEMTPCGAEVVTNNGYDDVTTYASDELPVSPSDNDDAIVTPTGNDDENVVLVNNTKGNEMQQLYASHDDNMTERKCEQCQVGTNGKEDANGVFYCVDCWNPEEDLYHHQGDAITTHDTIE